MDLSFFLPGEKTLGLKRISKMMSLTDPTSLQALLTASMFGESPDNTQIHTYNHCPKTIDIKHQFQHPMTENEHFFLFSPDFIQSSSSPFSSMWAFTRCV